MAFLPLESQTYDVEVVGPLAEVVVHQRFANPSGHFVDATYLFPLDPEAVVDRMVLHVGTRVIRSAISPRDEARARFEAAAERGQVAALLSERASSLFAQELSNIPPWSSVEVELTLIQPARRSAQGWELVLPLVSPPRMETRGLYVSSDELAERSLDPLRARLGAPVDITAVVHATSDLAELRSPSHLVDAAFHGHDGRAVLWSAEPDRDFVLRWTEAPRRAPAFSLLLGDEQAMLEVSPPELSVPDLFPREIVWVAAPALALDADPLEREAFAVARATLREDDTLVTAPSIDAALRMPPDPDRQRTLVLLGASRAEVSMLPQLAAHPEVSVVALGLGPVPDRDLLSTFAAVGGGPAVFLDLTMGELARAEVVSAALAPPILTDLRVDWADCPADQVSPARLPDLREGEPVRILAHLPSCFGPVWVSATSNGRRAEWAVWPERSPQPRALAVAWASARVAELERQARTGQARDVRAEVRAIGLAWGVVTSETSLIAVDQEVRNVTGERVPVTQPLSAGQLGGSEVTFADRSGGVEEIVVEASQAAVEVSSTSRAQVLSKQFLHAVPTGRSYQSAVTFAKGVAGAGGDPNSTFLMDGANITDPLTGTFSLNFNFDAIQQVEVLLGGLTPEHGGIAPIVNVVTRSGTNHLETSVAVRRTQRVDDGDASLSGEAATATLSGPVVRDKVWFLGSYGFEATSLDDPGGADRDFDGHTTFGKLTLQPSPEHRFALDVAGQTARVLQDGTPVSQEGVRSSGKWQWFLSPEAHTEATASSSWSGVSSDRRESQTATATASALSVDDPIGGEHDLKLGVGVQRSAWSFGSDWASDWIGVPVLTTDERTFGDGFAQDTWRPLRGLTVNGGLRLDVALGQVHPGPRLAAAWDPFGDQRTKLVVGYGRRYGLLTLPVALVSPEDGLPTLDELMAVAERELVEDVALGVDGTLHRHHGLPVFGGGRADRTTWSLTGQLRKIESKRWFADLSWSWTQLLEDPDRTLLVGEVGPELFAHEGTASLGWRLPTDPWTTSLGASGAVLTEPLGTFVVDPSLGALGGPRWTAGVQLAQAVDTRKGAMTLDLSARYVGLLSRVPSAPSSSVQSPWLEQTGWDGLRIEGGVGYGF